MNIIAVDDERILLEDLAKAIKVAIPECMLSCFKKPSEALKYAQDIKIDVAFLDIEMGGMNGLVLAKKLKDIYPKINIVFTTGYSHYALESYKVNASDYLLKPVKPEMIKNALENLRNPVERINQNKIRVQCFGNFEVFANDEPLQFSRSKTKELLAYLVLRQGAICTNNEISAVLWEDGVKTPSTKDYFRQLVSDLTHTFRNAGAEDIIMRVRSGIAIVPDKMECDLYRIKLDASAINLYHGEFMAQYSWAEFMNEYLENSKNKKIYKK